MNGDEESLGHMLGMDCEALSDYDTDSIIAELENRRPCGKCKDTNTAMCISCIWRDVWDMSGKNGHKDNFKEVTK